MLYQVFYYNRSKDTRVLRKYSDDLTYPFILWISKLKTRVTQLVSTKRDSISFEY
jgi:hypothetical protein